MEQMGWAPGDKDARDVQDAACPLQSSQKSAQGTAPVVGMERRASCSPRSRDDSAVCLRGQVILQGIAPVSIGGFPGVKRVLLSVTVHCSHEQQRCYLLADPLGRIQLPQGPGKTSMPTPIS